MTEREDYINKNKDIIKNWNIKDHYKNDEEMNELHNEFYDNGGKCYIYSFILYQKLQKIGAKRCRGIINSTDIIRQSKNPTEKCHHVWVETHNMVYDKSIFRTIIAPKNEWYQFYQISNVECADDGIFIKNNYVLNSGPDDIDS